MVFNKSALLECDLQQPNQEKLTVLLVNGYCHCLLNVTVSVYFKTLIQMDAFEMTNSNYRNNEM